MKNKHQHELLLVLMKSKHLLRITTLYRLEESQNCFGNVKKHITSHYWNSYIFKPTKLTRWVFLTKRHVFLSKSQGFE
jgi:hypothetical protein